MKCAAARRLFGAYWDDETTQAEREWLEAHFAACPACRAEYEGLARTLEWTGSLPRIEPAADLAERTLVRARRASPATDRISAGGVQWVPATAAAALLLIVGTLVSPWLGLGPGSRMSERREPAPSLREPERVSPELAASRAPGGEARRSPGGAREPVGTGPIADVTDSLFDHSHDVEFILDPMSVRRGRATMAREPSAVQGKQAVITF